MAKKKICTLKITKRRYPDKGIAFLDGEEIAVKHGIPGQVIEAECSRKKRQWTGRILRILEHGENEQEASCPDFGICGGCSFLSLPYEEELNLKKDMLSNLFKDIWKNEIAVIPAPKRTGYRNKMEFAFGDSGVGAGLALGIRKRDRYYEVAVPYFCEIIPDDFKTIVGAVLKYFRGTNEMFYHRMRKTGTLRHLILRRGEFSGEILVNLVTTDKFNTALLDGLKHILMGLTLTGTITGILHTICNSVADVVLPEAINTIYGRPMFYEGINGRSFGISPFSFFQTNSAGAELLYNTVVELAGDCETIYDLYCGTGTISQILNAKKVIGVELIKEAVEAAKENALLNKLDNCEFIACDVLEFLGDIKKPSPDALILDPPRSGIHPKALKKIVLLGVKKIIYISCKPTSLVRDLPSFLDCGYHIKDIRIHDMFPITPHMETVCLLEKRKFLSGSGI